MAGPIGLDWGVIMRIAQLKGIVIDNIFFEKLKAFETEALKGMNKKKDGD